MDVIKLSTRSEFGDSVEKSFLTTLIKLVRMRISQLHLPNNMCQRDVQGSCADINYFVYPSSGKLIALINLLFLMGETEVE